MGLAQSFVCCAYILFCDLGGFPCSSEMCLYCVVSAVVQSTVCSTPSVCERETEREGMSRAHSTFSSGQLYIYYFKGGIL